MGIPDRIRDLRKNYLHMNQTAFAERLGTTRSVIKNIELGVLAKPEQKLSLIKLLCKEFGVNEDWLLNGTGDMFITNLTDELDFLAEKYDLSDNAMILIEKYIELDDPHRKAITEYFVKVAKAFSEIDNKIDQ